MTRVFWTERGRQLVHAKYAALLRQWREPHEEIRVPTREGETFVVAAGKAGSPAMVLLHGGMATSAMWLRDIGFWAQRFRVLAVDIIGDAGFSAPSRPSMKSDAHAAWLGDVITALGVSKPRLVGASLGGWVALDYAIRRPGTVDGLFLIAPAGIGGFRPRFLLRAAPLLFLGPWGHRKALDLDMGFDPAGFSEDGASFAQLFKLASANFVARMQPIPVFSDDMLRSVRAPTLVMVGAEDALIDSVRTRERVERHMPNATVRVVAGAGHGLEVPTKLVASFFEGRHDGTPAA